MASSNSNSRRTSRRTGRRSMVAQYNQEDKDTTKTKVLVTINPNKPAKTEAEYIEKRDLLLDILGDFEQEKNLEEICGREPYVKKISTKDLGIERGSKYKRVHAHFILTIKHYVKKYSLKKLKDRIKEWLDLNGIGLANSWAVYLTLAPTFKENYATKERRRIAAEELEDEDPEELERLSDDRSERNYSIRGSHFTVLDPKQTVHIMTTGKRSYNKIPD